jgi:hypothetical protein
MSLYRITTDKLEPVSRTTFAAESLLERKDLQRLLRRDITPIADDLMVIAEEYGEWEDSNRRIDLLCLSKDGGLVVVEIKRTEDGGHMELQAIRYAAMVSAMTLDQVIQAYARSQGGELDEASAGILEFLQLDSEDEAELSGEVRIILVSADFSTELTTAVLWLNRQYEMGITCVRLRPYRMGADILIDATQIIPLPESADYEVKIREQEKEKKKAAGKRQEIFLRFWSQVVERSKARTSLFANRAATDAHWLSAGIGRSGFWLSLVLIKGKAIAECFIRIGQDAERSLAAFEALRAQKNAIETAFGGPLDWQDLPGKIGCRICTEMEGGWKSPESDWPELQDRMIDALIRLDVAIRKPIQELKI